MKRSFFGCTARYDGDAGELVQPLAISLAFASLFAGTGYAEETLDDSFRRQVDTIRVTADHAIQDPDHDRVTLSGNFHLHSDRWQITADSAEIRGRLEQPSLIDVTGRPAQIVVTGDGQENPLRGHSRRFRFEPDVDVIQFDGDASVSRDRQTVSSEAIRYQVERDLFEAGRGSAARVKVISRPK